MHSLKPKGSLGSQSLEPLKATPKNSPRKSSGRNLLLPQYSQVSLLIEGQNKVEAVRVFLMLHHVNQATTDLYIPIVPNIHIKSIREIRRNALQSCFPFCSDFCGEKKNNKSYKAQQFHSRYTLCNKVASFFLIFLNAPQRATSETENSLMEFV